MNARFGRIGLAVVTAAVVGGAAFAFTAANTVPASQAGDGAGAITGYTVTAVEYTLNATSPQNIDEVSFAVSDSPGEVYARVNPTGSFYTCTLNTLTSRWECNTTSPQAAVVSATSLQVVSVD